MKSNEKTPSVKRLFDFPAETETLIRSCDYKRSPAPHNWQDGTFLGDGDTGIMAFAPSHLEWIVNKTDLYDGTVNTADFMPHAEVMERVEHMNPKHLMFLEDRETGHIHYLPQTVSATVLRIKFWTGSGWNTPAVPLTEQTLSLYDAILNTSMDSAFLHPEVLSFVSRSSSVLCLRIHEPEEVTHTRVLELLRPWNEQMDKLPEWEMQNSENILAFSQSLPNGQGHYAVALLFAGNSPEADEPGNKKNKENRNPAVQISHGRLYGRMKEQSGKDAFYFLAVRTDRGESSRRNGRKALSDAVEAVRNAAERGFDALHSEHVRWWHDFWKRSHVDFSSEKDITRQWYFSLYALASSYGATPMPGLNGLTYGPMDQIDAGVGSSGYTHDQNVQIPMMPFFPLNHCEFIRPFAQTYLEMEERLKQQTRERFGSDGIYLPNNMTPSGAEIPVGAYRYTLCGSAYSGLILSLAWRYSRDRKLLESAIYPLLREFVSFYLGLLKKSPQDGLYHLDWSIPPEIFTLTRDDTATLAMLRTCLETLLETSEILHRDQDLRPLWLDLLDHYPPLSFRADNGAWWGGPDIPPDHYCYGAHLLYPFFPSEADLSKEHAEQTLEYIRNSGIEISTLSPETHPMHEWSAFLTGVTQLRLGPPEQGWNAMRRFLTLFGKPNRLFSHNPVLISDSGSAERSCLGKAPLKFRSWDGNFFESRRGSNDTTPNPEASKLSPPVLEGGSAFLFLSTETLLQSWGGEIRLFPAVPQHFTGYFARFRAQGGFLVSAAMEDGNVTAFRVEAPADGEMQDSPMNLVNVPGNFSMPLRLRPGEVCEWYREDAEN